jgi:hypothetical protein
MKFNEKTRQILEENEPPARTYVVSKVVFKLVESSERATIQTPGGFR